MVVTNEEKILAEKGGVIFTLTKIFVDLKVCQKIREMKILPKGVKRIHSYDFYSTCNA